MLLLLCSNIVFRMSYILSCTRFSYIATWIWLLEAFRVKVRASRSIFFAFLVSPFYFCASRFLFLELSCWKARDSRQIAIPNTIWNRIERPSALLVNRNVSALVGYHSWGPIILNFLVSIRIKLHNQVMFSGHRRAIFCSVCLSSSRAVYAWPLSWAWPESPRWHRTTEGILRRREKVE